MQQQFIPGGSRWLWIALVATLPWGCARVNDAGMRLVSSTLGGYLIVNGQMLTGDVTLIPDRTGRAFFTADKGAINNCSGGMRYTSSNGGEIDLRCNDGTQVALQITMLSETRGYGYASTAQGPASLTFGLSEQDARGFLTVPAGMVIAPSPKTGALELQTPKAGALGPAAGGGLPSDAAPAVPETFPLPVRARGR